MSKYRYVKISFILIISFFLSQKSYCQESCIDLGVGINISNDEYALIDFFKNGGRWEPNDADGHPWYKVYNLDTFKVVNGAYWHWDADWSGTINNEQWGDNWADCYISYYDMMVDQGIFTDRGYPIEVPFVVYKYSPKSVDPEQNPDLSQPVNISQFSRRIYFPVDLPRSGWVMKWEGTGRIRFEGLENVAADAGTIATQYGESWRPAGYGFCGYNYGFESSGEGRIETDLHWMIHGWVLSIIESDPTDPIRNIVFLYPGMEEEYDGGQRFQPQFLERMRQFKCLRYMGYLNGNGIEARTRVANSNPFHDNLSLDWLRWEERTSENWYEIDNGNGGNLEYIIELSNLTGTDPWVNIPYCAGEEYTEELVNLLLDGLNPDLTLYLEVGNELWNFAPGFNGYSWQSAKRVREYPGLGDVEARGAHINRIFGKVTEAAGSQNLPRIQRVYAGFPRYTDINNRSLNYIDKDNWDAFATTWYFTLSENNTTGNECRDAVSGNNWRTVLYNWYQANPNDQEGFNEMYKECLLNEFRCGGGYSNNSDVILANYYGKEIVCYEGGNHTFYGCENGPTGEELIGELDFDTPNYPDYITDNGFINSVCMADQSEQMAEIYDEIIDSLQSAGVRLANHLSFAGRSSCYGVWSFIQPKDMDESLSTILANYPKFRVFSERIALDNCDEQEVILDANTIGPGLSILLDGIDDCIVGQNSFIPDESSDYTIETWVKPLFTDTEQTILSFSNNGTDNNFSAIKIREDGRITWECGNNSTLHNRLTGPELQAKKWYHVALTKSGQRYTLYLNGVNVASKNISLGVAARSNYTLGALNYNSIIRTPFAGNIDEVRLWDIARSTNDIREYMCKKVSVSYTAYSNLRSYYRLDTPDYTNYRVYDRATSGFSGVLQNITITQRSRYAVSGAPIGDYSRYRYTGSWSGVSLSITHPDGDMIAASNFGAGSPDGVHVYIIEGESYYNTPPAYYDGISDERSFGVFMANGTDPNYDATYVYEGNPDALTGTSEANHRLLRRNNFSTEEWLHSGAKINTTANSLTVACKENSRGEYTLAFRHEETEVRPGSGIALLNNQAPTEENEGLIRYLDIDDFTVTFWGRGWGNAFKFSGKFGFPSFLFNIGVSYGGGAVGCGIRQNDENWQSQNISAGTSVATDTEWVHYAITRSGTRIIIYANGIPVAEDNLLSVYNWQEMRLFNDPDWQDGNYPGGVCNLALDELTVWNTALDQTTIREWMCKKINEEHPYECENLVLYFNFDQGAGTVLEDRRGPSDVTLNSVSSGFQYITSGAAIGDESLVDYSSPDQLTFEHPDGDNLEVSRTSGSSMGLHIYRTDHMPPVPSETDNTGILSVDSTRYWGVFPVKSFGATCAYSVTNYYEQNSQVILSNENELRMASRTANNTAPWSANIDALPNTTSHSLTLTNQQLGEYILAGTGNNTFDEYSAPEQPVFMDTSDTLNLTTICGNTTGLIYAVELDPAVETYVWSVPEGLDGFSTSDSITINASYQGSSSTTLILSVVAVNAYGESPAAEYVITVLPAPTIADAGPDQLVLPPTNFTVMDGNAPETSESGTWTLSLGSGLVQESENPYTQITSIGNGENSFIWSISNAACQPSTDSMIVLVAPPPQNVLMSDGSPLQQIFCEGEIITLRVIPYEDIANDGYQWILPEGMEQVSVNSDEIIVRVTNGMGGTIAVAALYGGNASPPYETEPVNINPLPNSPVFIESPSTLCLNVDISLSIQFDALIDSVEWILPVGVYPVDYPISTSENIDIQAIDTTSGYIRAKTYNNGCTNETAIDSFLFEVQQAPDKPILFLGTDGGTADPFCRGEYALLWVRNTTENVTYEWTWDVNTELIGYMDEVRSSALFDMPEGNNSIYVRSIEGEGACSASEWYEHNGWAWTEAPGTVNTITITDPVAQDPQNLQIGVSYTFEVEGAADYFFWDIPEGFELVDDGNIHDNINQLTVVEEGAGNLDVYAITLRGCSSHSNSLAISTGNAIFPPEYVSGGTEVCQGSNLNITVTDVGADTYEWILPNGNSYSTAVPTLDVTVVTPLKGMIEVSAIRGTYETPATEIAIEVQATNLNAVGFVDEYGNTIDEFELCNGDNDRPIYHLDALAESYIWEIHGTAMEFSPRWEPGHESEQAYELLNRTSPVDTMMPVNWVSWRCRNDGADGGYIVVTAVNGCGGTDVKDSIYYAWIQPLSVLVPEFVEEPTQLCVGSSANFAINPIAGANEYIWSMPNGLVVSDIVTNTPSITADVVNGTGGVITVYALGESCGGSQTIEQTTGPIEISGEALDFYFIDAPTAACPGEDITFTVNDLGVPVYNWSLPEGLRSTQMDDSDAGIVVNGSWNENNRDNMVNGQYRSADNYTERSISYRPEIPYTGTYRVSISYFTTYNSIPDMPVTINHSLGTDLVYVDTRIEPDNDIWQTIGDYYFDAGTTGSVEIATHSNGGGLSKADAVRFEILNIPGGTSQTFPVSGGEGGAVCVSVEVEQCESDYTICSDPVNLGGTLDSPVFTAQENSVCEGLEYTYRINDIGAESYTWHLPAGMSIGGNTGMVAGQEREVSITMDTEPAEAVQIGVSGHITSCNISSDTIYTNDITFDGVDCKLSQPVFFGQPYSLCDGGEAVVTVSAVQYAESYEWMLPAGITLTTGETGTVVTTDPSITIISDGSITGEAGTIQVIAQSTVIENSNPVNSEAVWINSSPVFTISTTDITDCLNPDGTLSLEGLEPSSEYLISYEFNSSPIEIESIYSDVNGEISISDLEQGTYNNFLVESGGCQSSDEDDYLLINTSTTTISNIELTEALTCEGTGSLLITFDEADDGDLFSIDFENDDIANDTSEVLSNQIVIDELPVGTEMNNLSVINLSNHCETSTTFAETINGPQAFSIENVEISDPDSCTGYGTISIELQGTQNGNVFSVDYTNDGLPDSYELLNNNGILINSLEQGTEINNITLTDTATSCFVGYTIADTIATYIPATIVSVSLTQPASCIEGGTLNIEVSDAQEGETFNIYFNNETEASQQGTNNGGTISLTAIAPGIHISEIQIESTITGCISAYPLDITVEYPAVTDVTLGTIPALCNNQGALELNHGTPGGGSYELNAVPVKEIDPEQIDPGSYPLVYIFTDANQCTFYDTVEVTIHSAPEAEIEGEEILCPGTEDASYSSTSNTIYAYNWTIAGGTIISGDETSEIIVTWGYQDSGTLSLIIIDNDNNCIDTSSITVTLTDSTAPEIAECPESVQFEPSFYENWYYIISRDDEPLIPVSTDACSGENVLTYFIAGVSDTLNVSEFIGYRLNPESDKEITWLFLDNSGNYAECTTSIEYIIDELPPSAFSPNGDMANDRWQMDFLVNYPNCVVKVFNRWRQPVFVSESGYPQQWDGRHKGKTLPVDSYYYFIELGEGNRVIKGYVTIIY